ncbi:MAG: hypothetical protein E7047_04580 [Lentisphaerae bacterium]|nr:hypothetical protein [Lentisphaerota bacterium]
MKKLFLLLLSLSAWPVSVWADYEAKFTAEAVKSAKYVYGASAGTIDGTPCLVIKGASCWGVELPAAEYANQKCTLTYEYKLDNVGANDSTDSNAGFKVQIVYTVDGKNRYTHREPLRGSSDWQSNTLKITFPENVSKIMLEVSAPSGKAYIRKLKLTGNNAAVSRSRNAQFQTVAPTAKPPVIDGEFSLDEWKSAACDHAFISKSDHRQSLREVSLFYTFDSHNLYLALLSVLPPPPQKLTGDDRAVIELTDPEGRKHTFNIYANNSNDLPDGSRYYASRSGRIHVDAQLSDTPRWISEIAIPWQALNRSDAPDGETWQLQVRRVWLNPAEEAVLSPEPLQLTLGSSKVASSIRLGLRGEACRVNFAFFNPTRQVHDLQIDLLIRSLEVPQNMNRNLTLQPGERIAFEQYFMLGRPLDRKVTVTVKDKNTGHLIYSREVDWNISSGLAFHDPDPPITMNFGLAPSQQRIIAKVESASAARFSDIKSVRFKIINADNVVKQIVTAERKAPGYYYQDWNYPPLPVGEYFVVAELVHNNGHTEALRKSFWIRNFDWENTQVAMERMVPPPFVPLQSSGNEIKALQTGYNIDGMFWNKVFALNENILSGNVKLVFNGNVVATDHAEFTEHADDLIVRKSHHSAPGLKVELLQEYEFDGVCKATFKFIPESGVKCESLYIDIPLKASVAQLLHNTGKGCRSNDSMWVPAGSGTVFKYRCTRNFINYPSYFYLGGIFKGFCHFSDEIPAPFDAVSEAVTHEIIRNDSSVTLRVHLAPAGKNLPLKEFDYVCGFQPTPVKPRPQGFRQWAGGMTITQFPNTYMKNGISHYKQCFSDARLGHPLVCYNNDYGFIDYLLTHRQDNAGDQEIRRWIADFLKKNDMTDEKWEEVLFEGDKASVSERMYQTAYFGRNKLLHLYANPRAGYRNWPESEMYDDEWMDWGFRQPDDSYYHRIPVKSYSDMFLYRLRDFLRRFPLVQGVYYDCLYPNKSISPFLGGRYLAPNRYSFTCDIFHMRELMKRSLKLMAMERRFLPCDRNYPWLEIHMTDCNMAPVVGLATFNLNWEMNFGRMDYQDRFPEEFNLVQTLGTQTGTIPGVIVQTSGSVAEREHQQRTLLAVGFAFDVLNFYDAGSCEDQLSGYYPKTLSLVRQFGYGTGEVEHFPGYLPEANPVKCTPAQVRITTLKHKDGRLMLLVGNLGEKCQVKLTVPDNFVDLVNAENGQRIVNHSFELKKHDNAILTGRWK